MSWSASAEEGAIDRDGHIRTALIVRGVVRDPGGVAVPDAGVAVAWRPWACGELDEYPLDTTTAAGEFEVWLSEWGEFPAACDGPDPLALQLTLAAP